MVDLSLAENENQKIALSFLKHIEDGKFIDALHNLCREDVTLHAIGIRKLEGRAEAFNHFGSLRHIKDVPPLRSTSSYTSDVACVASAGTRVFVERTDHHHDSKGRELITTGVVSVFEISDGRIVSLRDFFESARFRDGTKPQLQLDIST